MKFYTRFTFFLRENDVIYDNIKTLLQLYIYFIFDYYFAKFIK